MIVYIHGASATSQSFNHIRQYVRASFDKPDMMIEYSSDDGFAHNVSIMKSKLDIDDNLFFISHSLGGIYSLYLANHFKDKTIGGVSLSTPYGGSVEADFAQYFLPFNRLMKDIGTLSHPMRVARQLPTPPNWTQIVTTCGQSPWIQSPNDGVVTIESMKYRKDFEQIEVALNHYEVVISDLVVDIILEKLKIHYG